MELSAAELVIEAEGVTHSDMRALVVEHFEEMIATAAPESSHALSLELLAKPEITLFGVRRDRQLLGCGALKELDSFTGEVKTMRTVAIARGLGIGGIMLDHLVYEARRRQYQTVYLETGAEDFFEPARGLYLSRGFEVCGPFADYRVDAHSVFMMLGL